ncbi:LOG family protein [Alsobacter sp. R-9]
MTDLRSVCVYCGSGFGADPVFARAATALGRRLAEENINLVYGGGNVGLMGTVARAVLDHGGHVTGIIPEFLRARELMIADAQELVVVPDMHTRKRLMFEKADAFVALPGGIGTLEELVEQMTWAQLGQHRKPILVANVAKFWDPLLGLLQHMKTAGFVREGFEVNFLLADDVEAIVPMLRSAIRGLSEAALEGEVEDNF